jgi:NHS family xanthosine MFS transporter
LQIIGLVQKLGRNSIWIGFGTIELHLYMPTLTGIIADRWINAEKIIRSITFMGFIHIPQVATPETFIYIMLLAMCFLHTIALSNSISYNALN